MQCGGWTPHWGQLPRRPEGHEGLGFGWTRNVSVRVDGLEETLIYSAARTGRRGSGRGVSSYVGRSGCLECCVEKGSEWAAD